MSHINKFWRLPLRRKQIAFQVTALMLIVRLLLALLPFRTLRRWLHQWVGWLPLRPLAEGYQADVVWAAERGGRLLFGDKGCLTQALVVQWLLRRRGLNTDLHIGVVRQETGTILAHAWVEDNGRIIIGGDRSHLQTFTPIAALRAEERP